MKANAFHDRKDMTPTRAAAPGVAPAPALQPRYHWAVFRQTIRFNHSCRPNAATDMAWPNGIVGYKQPPGTVNRPRITIRALQRIEQGDEITIDYHAHNPNNFEDTEARQMELNNTYGFNCACPSCSNPQLSDARRLIIRQHLGNPALANATNHRHRNLRLPPNAEGVCSDALRRLVRELLHAIQEEGIKDLRLANAYYFWSDALSRCAPPEINAAFQALDQAKNILRICYGPDHRIADHQLRRRGDLYRRWL